MLDILSINNHTCEDGQVMMTMIAMMMMMVRLTEAGLMVTLVDVDDQG